MAIFGYAQGSSTAPLDAIYASGMRLFFDHPIAWLNLNQGATTASLTFGLVFIAGYYLPNPVERAYLERRLDEVGDGEHV